MVVAGIERKEAVVAMRALTTIRCVTFEVPQAHDRPPVDGAPQLSWEAVRMTGREPQERKY